MILIRWIRLLERAEKLWRLVQFFSLSALGVGLSLERDGGLFAYLLSRSIPGFFRTVVGAGV
jgi:hypothetical protein